MARNLQLCLGSTVGDLSNMSGGNKYHEWEVLTVGGYKSLKIHHILSILHMYSAVGAKWHFGKQTSIATVIEYSYGS